METLYEKKVGRSLYADQLDEYALAEARADRKEKLDNATSACGASNGTPGLAEPAEG